MSRCPSVPVTGGGSNKTHKYGGTNKTHKEGQDELNVQGGRDGKMHRRGMKKRIKEGWRNAQGGGGGETHKTD